MQIVWDAEMRYTVCLICLPTQPVGSSGNFTKFKWAALFYSTKQRDFLLLPVDRNCVPCYQIQVADFKSFAEFQF